MGPEVLTFYTKRMACAICETRRPRRFCPGVRGDICTICCGTEREVSVTCPLDCEYLQEAHRRERLVALDPEQIPNRDIRVSQEFMSSNHVLTTFIGDMLGHVAAEAGVVDNDVREALDGLIRTYRTLESGVYYESVPQNPLAAAIYRRMQELIGNFRQQEQEHGVRKTRDADVLGVLVFFQRGELDRNNGRPRGRAFIGMLQQLHVASAEAAGGPEPASSPLILP